MERLFRVIFTGDISPDYDVDQVKQNVAALYKVPIVKIEPWFSGRNITVKNAVSYKIASKYTSTLEKAGAICRLEEILQEKDEVPLSINSQQNSTITNKEIVPVAPALKSTETTAERIVNPGTSEKIDSSRARNSKLVYILAIIPTVITVGLLGFYFISISPKLKSQEAELKKLREDLKQQEAEAQFQLLQQRRAEAKQADERYQKLFVALKKIDVAASSGINYREYSSLVNNAMLEFELLKSSGANDSPKFEHLAEITLCYQLAKSIWGAQLQEDYDTFNEALQFVCKTYNNSCYRERISSDFYAETFGNKAVQFLWGKSSEIFNKYGS